jgi:integrase/recombinase XerD
MKHGGTNASLGTLVHAFFCERLLSERNASPRTVSGYRDSIRLLLQFMSARTKRAPSRLLLVDLDAPLVLKFLDDLEKRRHNSSRTRNTRLAAVKSFVKYIAYREPVFLLNAERILAIPMKRFDRPMLSYLTRDEVDAISSVLDRSTWSGRRDHVLFATFYNTGARVSELTGLKVTDVCFGETGYIRLYGKGRKERSIPLWKSTVKEVESWISYLGSEPTAPLFPNRKGQPLTRSGVEYRLRIAVQKATLLCPSLEQKNVSPHTYRHTTAMHLLQAGVDLSTIALWLGHESPATTHTYIEADLQMKQTALDRLQEPQGSKGRYRPPDKVLAFLDSL